MSLLREDCIHPFDTGFIPKISDDRDAIIVTHSSPLILRLSAECASATIAFGAVRSLAEAEGAPYAVDPEVGLARCASRSGHTMKNLPLHSLMSPSLQNEKQFPVTAPAVGAGIGGCR